MGGRSDCLLFHFVILLAKAFGIALQHCFEEVFVLLLHFAFDGFQDLFRVMIENGGVSDVLVHLVDEVEGNGLAFGFVEHVSAKGEIGLFVPNQT